MKKIISVFLTVILTVSLVSCSGAETEKQVELTDEDYQYIDTVYNSMSGWDLPQYDSGQNWNIHKISFFDFDGTNKLTFYVNYPITDVYGHGYYVYTDRMTTMSIGVYDHDERTRNSGWITRNTVDGIDWDSSATDEEKYETIKEAYIHFLQTNIYDN